jgi:hypothetical protein
VSFLFLAITLYVLTRTRQVWILPVLFALWVNLDAWFILGPLTLALYVIGSLGQRLAGQAPQHCPGKLALALLAGVAACLLNPYFYRAFTLPSELAYLAVRAGGILPDWMIAAGETVQGLIAGEEELARPQQLYRLLWLSPLSQTWRSQFGLGFNVAGLAYFPLLLLGLASFIVPALRNPREFPWPRLLVWLFFAFLSLVMARLIPFFAVVAGPIMVLNFQEYVPWLSMAGIRTQSRRPVLPRLATALVLLALIFLDWPGWLHTRIYPFDFNAGRRVGWDVHFDPSLKQAALRLDELHKRGVIRNGFAFSPDVACYCAWFAPDVKGFIDYRLQLFADRAKSFARIRPRLASYALDNRPDLKAAALAEWRGLADQFDINYLVATNFSRGNSANLTRLAAGACWIDPEHWPWLYGDGRTLIFGWNLTGADTPLRREALALNKLAFGTVAETDRAPAAGALPPEGLRNFWTLYLEGSGGTSLALDAAEQFQIFHKLSLDQLQLKYVRLAPWLVMHGPASLAGVVPWSASLPPAMLTMSMYPVLGAPAAPVLSMREIRRALAQDPFDPSAYEVLARAVDLEGRLQEDLWQAYPQLTSRRKLRQLQTIAAWKGCLTLRPNDFRAHEALFVIYERLQYLDVALEHLSGLVANWRPPPVLTAQAQQQVERQIKAIEAHYQQLTKEVRKRQDDYDLRATGLPATQKVDLALGNGLVRRALQALQQANPNQLSPAESFGLTLQQINLRLNLGDFHEVNSNISSLKALGNDYYRAELECAAIAGDYDRADTALRELLNRLALKRRLPRLALIQLMKLAPSPIFTEPFTLAAFDSTGDMVLLLHQAADCHFLRGVLALERGDTRLAEAAFRQMLDLLAVGLAHADRPVAEHYLKLIRDNK